MSFSKDLKNEIAEHHYKNPCCRRALLHGIILVKGICDEDNNIRFNIENNEYASFACKYIKEFFGVDAGICVPEKGGRCKTVKFKSKAAARFLMQIDESQDTNLLKCPACQMALVRGIYMACGRLSDPTKQFCLEFSPINRVEYILTMFENMGITLKFIMRKSEKILYTKNSTVIEDFLATAELNDAAFTVMNIKIKNGIVNRVNRIRNLEAVNISRGVDAATEQRALIEELQKRRLLSQLPEELEMTARLRLKHPDMTLSRLAMHSVPPISKSGITHRMKKIMTLGAELLEKKKKK